MFTGRRTAIRRFLPAGLLAVALQICLPIVMFRVVVTSFDPLDQAAICHASTSNDSGIGDSGDIPNQHHHNVCPLCQISSTSHMALLSVPVGLLAPSLLTERIVSDPAQSAGPRGPPLRGVQARAPPAIS